MKYNLFIVTLAVVSADELMLCTYKNLLCLILCITQIHMANKLSSALKTTFGSSYLLVLVF